MNSTFLNQLSAIIYKSENDRKYKNLEFDKKDRHFWTMYKTINDNNICPNITLYYCLFYKYKNTPLDFIYIINEFLNWMPAGCYKQNNLCIECSCPRYLNNCDINEYYRTSVTNFICSWNCLEKNYRYRIEVSERENFRKLIS